MQCTERHDKTRFIHHLGFSAPVTLKHYAENYPCFSCFTRGDSSKQPADVITTSVKAISIDGYQLDQWLLGVKKRRDNHRLVLLL